MIKSDMLDKLAPALVKFQGEAEPILKDMANPFFKSRYADLAGCIGATKNLLAANGLAVSQPTRVEGSNIIIVTVLLHSSGQFIAGEYLLTPVKNDPQTMGGAMTYGRRYSYLAAIGLAPEDDDGALASGTTKDRNESLTNQLKASAPVAKAQPQPKQAEQIPPPSDHDTFDDIPPSDAEVIAAGKHVITLGKKFAGRTIESVGVGPIVDYLAWLESSSRSKGEPVGQKWHELHDLTKIYSRGLSVNA